MGALVFEEIEFQAILENIVPNQLAERSNLELLSCKPIRFPNRSLFILCSFWSFELKFAGLEIDQRSLSAIFMPLDQRDIRQDLKYLEVRRSPKVNPS